MPQELSRLGRRVLASLPLWAEDEAAFVEAEGGPEQSVRAYSLPDFHLRLAEDPSVPNMTPQQVEACLAPLKEAGLAEQGDGGWKMTQIGLETLRAPSVGQADQVPGQVFVELHPAQDDASL